MGDVMLMNPMVEKQKKKHTKPAYRGTLGGGGLLLHGQGKLKGPHVKEDEPKNHKGMNRWCGHWLVRSTILVRV